VFLIGHLDFNTHNIQETNNAPYQPGGTAVVIMNQLSHRAQ